jgi:hypothetical protein
MNSANLTLPQKITKLTTYLIEVHPELYKFVDEMPITIPIEKNPLISNGSLESYFESLSLLLLNNLKLKSRLISRLKS